MLATTQLSLFPETITFLSKKELLKYDKALIFFSGGKDSLASLITILEMGYPRKNIELHHHLVDGKNTHFMDWPITEAYCRAVAKALKIPLYFSWREGGFEREMLRNNQPTAPSCFETPEGCIGCAGGHGKPNTRLRYPQISSSLSVRYCSAYCKIMISDLMIRNQERFNNQKTLCISGERAEESAARAKYKILEPDRADNRNGKSQRYVDRYRPVHQMKEEAIWDLIREWKIFPHPAYLLGFSRCSCMHCIFSGPDQIASAAYIDPDGFHKISQYEEQFGVTIHRTLSVLDRVKKGKPVVINDDLTKLAMSTQWDRPIFVEHWELPAGAFKNSPGPV